MLESKKETIEMKLLDWLSWLMSNFLLIYLYTLAVGKRSRRKDCTSCKNFRDKSTLTFCCPPCWHQAPGHHNGVRQVFHNAISSDTAC